MPNAHGQVTMSTAVVTAMARDEVPGRGHHPAKPAAAIARTPTT